MRMRRKYIIYPVFLTCYAIVAFVFTSGMLSNSGRLLLLNLTIFITVLAAPITINMLADMLYVIFTPVRILYRLGHFLFMKLPGVIRVVLEKTAIVAWGVFCYGGLIYLNIDARMERYNSGRVPDKREAVYRASSIVQELSYRVYEYVNPSPYDDYKENCLKETQVKFNRGHACDLVREMLGSRYTVHTDGYNMYIQYNSFHRDTINHPVSLLRMKIPWDDINLGDFLAYRGFTSVIFRDTDWYYHIRRGPLVVPLNSHNND